MLTIDTSDVMTREFILDLVNIDDPLHSQNKNIDVKVTSEDWMSGYFCWDSVFNLTYKVLNETEIKVLKEGLVFAPIQKK